MDKREARKAAKQAGTIFIMVMFLSLLLAGSAAYLLVRTRTELVRQRFRKYVQAAMQYAIGAMEIAQVKINNAEWNAGTTADMNSVLWNAEGGCLPGLDGTDGYKVEVNKIADTLLWYELVATGEAGDTLTGMIKRVIKLRVRDRDFFSRWNMYCETGVGIVDDTNCWYGDVHTNNALLFRNRIPDVGARFYGNVTACNPPQDYAESGGVAEAYFLKTPNWNADRVELPGSATLSELRKTAQSDEDDTGDWVTLGAGDTLAAKIWVGPKGVSILPLADFGTVSLVFRKEWDEAEEATKPHQELDIIITDSSDREFTHTLTSLPWESIIHCETEIEGVKGVIYSRVLVVSETGRAQISDDIVYEDANDRPKYLYPSDPTYEPPPPNHPYEYDQENPEDTNNFTVNPAYSGDACFGLLVKKDILLTNQSGDLDLVIHGVYAAGVGGEEADGAVRWLDQDEPGWDVEKRDLRLFGAMIADGHDSTTGMTVAHFKGWGSGAGSGYGYNNSTFRYDHSLRTSPPPSFMEVKMPLYTGWEYCPGGE